MENNKNNELLNEDKNISENADNGTADQEVTESLIERSAEESPTATPKKKSKKKLLRIIIPIVIIAVLAVAAIFIYQEIEGRKCAAAGCNEWEKGKGYGYCAKHTCEYNDCHRIKTEDRNSIYCEDHKCSEDDCIEIRIDEGSYCEKHTCTINGCLRGKRDYYDICSIHYLEQENAAKEEAQEKINKLKKKYNITATAKDVKYSPYSHLGSYFTITGTAELDDYFNYDYADLEMLYFCIAVTPTGGSYSDRWYLYADRRSNAELLEKLKSGKMYNVTFVARGYYPDSLKNSMADMVEYCK